MLKMPEADPQTLKKRASIAAALRRIVPGEGVIETRTEMSVYESDGLTAYRQMPLVVVLPKTTAEVAKVLRYAFENKIKVVPRGCRHLAVRRGPAAGRRHRAGAFEIQPDPGNRL